MTFDPFSMFCCFLKTIYSFLLQTLEKRRKDAKFALKTCSHKTKMKCIRLQAGCRREASRLMPPCSRWRYLEHIFLVVAGTLFPTLSCQEKHCQAPCRSWMKLVWTLSQGDLLTWLTAKECLLGGQRFRTGEQSFFEEPQRGVSVELFVKSEVNSVPVQSIVKLAIPFLWLLRLDSYP